MFRGMRTPTSPQKKSTAAKAENYQMTDAAHNDKNSDKACPSGDPRFISVTFTLQTMLQIPVLKCLMPIQ
jgi:hypothetical protein